MLEEEGDGTGEEERGGKAGEKRGTKARGPWVGRDTNRKKG